MLTLPIKQEWFDIGRRLIPMLLILMHSFRLSGGAALCPAA